MAQVLSITLSHLPVFLFLRVPLGHLVFLVFVLFGVGDGEDEDEDEDIIYSIQYVRIIYSCIHLFIYYYIKILIIFL